MGRYYNFSNGDEGKFWFACQPTDDICSFGGQESPDNNMIHWSWSRKKDLPIVNCILKTLCKDLKQSGYKYRDVFNSNGKHPPKKIQMLVARMHLGAKIRRGLRKDEFLEVDAEC